MHPSSTGKDAQVSNYLNLLSSLLPRDSGATRFSSTATLYDQGVRKPMTSQNNFAFPAFSPLILEGRWEMTPPGLPWRLLTCKEVEGWLQCQAVVESLPSNVLYGPWHEPRGRYILLKQGRRENVRLLSIPNRYNKNVKRFDTLQLQYLLQVLFQWNLMHIFLAPRNRLKGNRIQP